MENCTEDGGGIKLLTFSMEQNLNSQQAEDLVKQKFEFPLPNVEDQDDPLMKGEFMVMLELMQELPGAKEGKEKVNNSIFRQGQKSYCLVPNCCSLFSCQRISHKNQ